MTDFFEKICVIAMIALFVLFIAMCISPEWFADLLDLEIRQIRIIRRVIAVAEVVLSRKVF